MRQLLRPVDSGRKILAAVCETVAFRSEEEEYDYDEEMMI